MISWYRDSGELGTPGLMGNPWGGEEDMLELEDIGEREEEQLAEVVVDDEETLEMFAMGTRAMG